MAADEAKTLWNKACRHLEDTLHQDVFSRWIAVIEAKDVENSTLTLAVDNDFYQTWLEENYLPLISKAISAVSGAEMTIRFIVDHGHHEADEPKIQETQKKPSIRERLTGKSKREPALNEKYLFDSFIVGPSNHFAHAAALAVAQAPARAYNPLFIYGGVGLGKTHLMQAIGQHVLSTTRSKVVYMSSEAFLNEYIDDLQKRRLVQFRKKYRGVDLLLIDDIHFLAGKKQLQEEFFHTFNALFDARKQIVLTSDRPANEIPHLEQRLVSRFEWGLVTELEPPDLETRIAILRNNREKSNASVSDDILLFIAENVNSNVRRLEGAMLRVTSYASLTGKEVTVDSLSNLLSDILDQEKKDILTCETIQKSVADHYDVRLSDMTSTRRQRSVALPRQIAMYLCRRLTPSSLPDIAKSFSKTHATILHAYRSIEQKAANNVELKQNIRSVAQKLGRKLV